MANKIPQTFVKLSQQLGLVGYHQVDNTANPFDAKNALDILRTVVSFKAIGATNRFQVSQERDNYTRRGINSPIEAFGIAPGPITTTINMDRVVLNTEDAMAAFQFMPGNLAFQTRPLVVVEITYPAIGEDGLPVVRVPPTSKSGDLGLANVALGVALTGADLAKTPVYSGCWIASSSIEYKLEGKQAVMQNVTLEVSRISPAVAVVFPSIEQRLISNFSVVTRGLQLTRTIGQTISRFVR